MANRNEVEKLARLAHLKFDKEELDRLTDEMGEIIAFADTINANVGEIDMRSANARSVEMSELREDEVTESYPNEKILSNVEGDRGYFPVKRSKTV